MDDISKNIDFHEKKVFFQYKIPICIFILMIFPIFHTDLKMNFPTTLQVVFIFFAKNEKSHVVYMLKIQDFSRENHHMYIFFHQMRIIDTNHHIFLNPKKTHFLSNFQKPKYTENEQKNENNLNYP